jgi:hypothetical protein
MAMSPSAPRNVAGTRRIAALDGDDCIAAYEVRFMEGHSDPRVRIPGHYRR